MLITVASILELPVVRAGAPEIIAGAEALETPVRWVHVSEQLELTDLLQGGELILSTGLLVGADPQAAETQLRDLERAGAAGVIVELPPGREPTQAALRRATAGAALPVVILHQRVRFVELTEAVHRLIVAEQMEQLEASRRIHELFTDLVLNDASAEDIVRAAASELDAAVLLEDPSGRVLHVHVPGAGSAPAAVTAALARRDGVGVRELVSVRESAWGRLVVPGREDASARHVAQRAAQALALHLMAERDARDLAQLAQSAFLTELASWSAGEDAAEQRAASLGLASAGRVVPLVIRMEGADGDPLALSRLERELRAELSHAVGQAGATALVGHAGVDALAVLLAPSAKAQRGATLDRVASALAGGRTAAGAAGAAGADGGAHGRFIGVGPAGAGVLEAVAGLAEASHVAAAAQRLGRGAHPGRPWFTAADVRLPGLVAVLAEDARVRRFAASELGALTSPGREGDLELLRAMVDTGGAKARVAQRLFLSRPAVYHRISRLEEELGVSLQDPASLTSLAVALLVNDLG
ncbi:PucR family transcriptional regulator [Galactobacter valiniphilus]|nr:PucR family transcriptional regulator [Galactobacter valiniphilus]